HSLLLQVQRLPTSTHFPYTTLFRSEPAHLFKPADAIRVRRNVNNDTPFPPEIPHAMNPPLGAVIYYSLGAPPSGEITLDVSDARSEEHTSELQSRFDLVCRLLLEKK